MLFFFAVSNFSSFSLKKSLFKCCSFSLHWFYSSFHTKEDSPSRAGEVLVSLCYLPTTNRLTFVVLKARLSKTSFPNDLPREYNLYFSWKKISVWFYKSSLLCCSSTLEFELKTDYIYWSARLSQKCSYSHRTTHRARLHSWSLNSFSTVSLQLGSEVVQTPVKTEREGNLGKVSVEPHTIVKQICFPNGNVLFLSLFSLFKNWMYNVVSGCAEILPRPFFFD